LFSKKCWTKGVAALGVLFLPAKKSKEVLLFVLPPQAERSSLLQVEQKPTTPFRILSPVPEGYRYRPALLFF